jgi:hypothetical protein
LIDLIGLTNNKQSGVSELHRDFVSLTSQEFSRAH